MDYLQKTADKLVSERLFAGVEWRVDQGGKNIFAGKSGVQDLARKAKIPENALYRVYSMTKPIISVLALQLIEDGILKNYLVDTYNGKKLNLKSNGRSGGTTNLYFEKGGISYEDLMKKNSRSLYITETIGHGSNIVTGDYSVGATGFLVEDGEFKYPVNEITIAGNFKDMFKNIILANDLEFEYSVNSPTMMIEGMTVAGK